MYSWNIVDGVSELICSPQVPQTLPEDHAGDGAKVSRTQKAFKPRVAKHMRIYPSHDVLPHCRDRFVWFRYAICGCTTARLFRC